MTKTSGSQPAKSEERALDDALASGVAPDDPEIASLARAARDLERTLAADAPRAHRERALFVQGVAARKHRFSPLRVLVPALATAAVLAFVGLLGSRSLPGDDLYAVRAALADLGIVSTPLEDADRRIVQAQDALARADLLVDSAPGRARRLAVTALVDLGQAARVAERAGSERRLDRVSELEEDAFDVIEQASESRAGAGPGESSGPGSENSGPGSENSGPGSDDGGGDSSGPGSGGSGSGGDDSSGSGSSGSGGSGDSSGSGGGGGSSGSGSSGSGSSGPG